MIKLYKKKLLDLGINASTQGFEMLNYAIEVYVPRQSLIALYETVAEQFGTKMQRAERNMRHAVESTGEQITLGQFIAKYKILWEESK